jgi:hypothetical protein
METVCETLMSPAAQFRTHVGLSSFHRYIRPVQTTQGVPSFSFTVQPRQRPISIFRHWCARAACLRLSTREQWPSVSLKTWTCVPTSIHYPFSWSASSDMNFHTLEGLIKFPQYLAIGTHREIPESAQHIHILFLQDMLGQKKYPPAYA